MARNGSRFNKFLNFIGLVDETDDRGYDVDVNRPQGASTYNPPQRSRQQSSARPVRQQDDFFNEPRYSQQRDRDDYYQTRDNQQSRYSEPQRDYRSQSSRDYERDYRSASSSTSRQYSQTRRSENEPQRSAPRNEYPPQRAPRLSEYRQQAVADEFEQQPARNMQPREYQQNDQPPRQNVVNLRGEPRQETVIFYLHQLEECRDVITALLDNKTVLLNLEDMDERLVQRAIDTLCGAAFALNAALKKASDKTYLIAPTTVNVQTRSDDDRY